MWSSHELKIMEESMGSMPHFFCIKDLMKSKGFQVGWVREEHPQGEGSKKGYWIIFRLALQVS